MSHLFQFTLKPIERCMPFGDDEDLLHWFGLTDGHYYLQLGEDEIFRYSSRFLKHLKAMSPDIPAPESPFVDYYTLRLYEDLLSLLPHALEVVPDDIIARTESIDAAVDFDACMEQWLDLMMPPEGGQSEDTIWDTFITACGWWDVRRLDTGYLTGGPQVWFWRKEDTIYIQWDHRSVMEEGHPVWYSTDGNFELPVAEFLSEVNNFHERLCAAMAERVKRAASDWPLPEVRINIDELAEQQQQFAARKPIGNPVKTNWKAVREAIETIEHFLRTC